MRSQICRYARTLLSAASKQTSRSCSGGRTAAAAATVSCRGRVSSLASSDASESEDKYNSLLSGLVALNTAFLCLQLQEAHTAEVERTFIAIKPVGVQRGLISEIISRFEHNGYKLVAIKILVPKKEFAQKHHHDLKYITFFNGLCEFLSSGPDVAMVWEGEGVEHYHDLKFRTLFNGLFEFANSGPIVAMVWEGEGVIKYGRKLIGATYLQKSEPGTIRGDSAVVVGRNIMHGSYGPQSAKDEIKLWFKPEELISYTGNAEMLIYGDN